jgi:antitoxin MazE
MQATISKWGNSLALRLPKHVAEQVRLVEGATVELEISDGSLKVTPARKRFKLAELLDGEKRETDDNVSREVDWGKPKGDEAW